MNIIMSSGIKLDVIMLSVVAPHRILIKDAMTLSISLFSISTLSITIFSIITVVNAAFLFFETSKLWVLFCIFVY